MKTVTRRLLHRGRPTVFLWRGAGVADRNRLESGRWQRCQPRVRIPPPLRPRGLDGLDHPRVVVSTGSTTPTVGVSTGSTTPTPVRRCLLGAAELQGHGVVDEVVEALAVPLEVVHQPL